MTNVVWEDVGPGSEGIIASLGTREVVVAEHPGEVFAQFIFKGDIIEEVDFDSIREAMEAGEKYLKTGIIS